MWDAIQHYAVIISVVVFVIVLILFVANCRQVAEAGSRKATPRSIS
jgi:hypothetical protein